jgi:hypothetical protein
VRKVNLPRAVEPQGGYTLSSPPSRWQVQYPPASPLQGNSSSLLYKEGRGDAGCGRVGFAETQMAQMQSDDADGCGESSLEGHKSASLHYVSGRRVGRRAEPLAGFAETQMAQMQSDDADGSGETYPSG